MSRGQPHLRSQTTRRIFERCQNKDNTKDAIIIDDDIDNVDVVLLDNPNISHHGPNNTKTARLNCLPRDVIYIDDEGEDIKKSSGDTTSNQFGEGFSGLSSSEDLDSDECVMFVGNGNIYHDHAGPSRNRYGISLESECSTTESTSLKSSIHECDDFEVNGSDCEMIEDHSGNIRELWEKAASRKKESGRFASSDQATASGSTDNPECSSNAPTLNNSDTGNCSDEVPSDLYEELLAEFCSFSPHNAEENPSANVFSTDEHETIQTTVNISVAQSGPNSNISLEKTCNWKKDDKSNPEKCSQTAQSMDDVSSFLNKDEQVPIETSFCTNDNYGKTSFLNKDEQVPIKTSFCTNDNYGKTSFSDIEEPCCRTSNDSPTWDGKQVSTDNVICQDKMEKNLGKISYNTQSKYESVAEHEAPDFKERKKRDSENVSPFCSEKDEQPLINSENSDVHGNLGVSGNNKVEAVFVKSDVGLTSQNEPDDMPHSYKSLICERERHKETNEYKRVAEEEWASRQRQLQIQAEEAQRMRKMLKRRKAENLRLLDMEKRQKQRLEEVRELQKKDEETTQLKEQIQTEVRKDLERVEMKYRDMTSVLRALGIHVKGGLSPMVHEVNAAYKQALLRFHPDRASRTDIRQQVEAEEKFKLISRLKEKLLL